MIVNHPTFADAAALATRLGLKLFPVRLIPGPHGALNKVPAVKGGHGYLDASDDPAVLTGWATAYPRAAIGVPCRPNGFIALDNAASYDPPPLAPGAGATTTVTLDGAAPGDHAEASFSLDLQGITLTAYVSAPNTVSVRFQNGTPVTLNLTSGTLRVRVARP